MLIELLQLFGGLAVLVLGADVMIRGSVALAKNFGVPTLVVGLTIVALGTSAPEMVVSVQAVLNGLPDISIGNIVGSNVTNVLLVLGITALIFPIDVEAKVLKRDTPWMMFATILFAAFMFNGMIERPHAAALLALIFFYLIYLFNNVKKGADADLVEELEEETDVEWPTWKAFGAIVVGIAAMIIGSDQMVIGASELARSLGVTEAMIGLTIVAFGTSAPELMACVVAAYRKHSDIAIGNIIGSNLFNVATITGVAGLVHPIAVNPSFLDYDVWLLLLVSMVLVAFMLTGRKICRTEGALLAIGYVAYTLWQVQQGTGGGA